MIYSPLPLSVVFTGNFPYPHGFAGTKRVQQYMDHLMAQGVSVAVLVLRGLPVLPGNEAVGGEYRGARYVVVGRGLRPGVRLPLEFLRFVRESWRGLCAFERPGHCNILVHYGRPSIENIRLLRRARRGGWIVVHDVVEDAELIEAGRAGVVRRFKVWTMKRFSRMIPRLSDGLVVISRHLEEKYAGCGPPMVRIPIAAPVRDGPALPERSGPACIAYAGTHAAKDGLETLLRAFQAVRREYPDCVLRLAGGRASPLDAAPSELKEGVSYAGYLDEEAYDRFLRAADILCMTRTDTPFAHAGFPFKLGEYLATGRPVVASRVSNLEEYLADGREVLLVEPDDVGSLREGLLRLLREPGMAREMGRRGQEACRRHFDPAAAGAALHGLLCRIAGSAAA